MKKLLTLLILLFSINIYSQQNNEEMNSSRNEINLESDSGKFYQGVFVGAFSYLIIQQITFESKDEWVKIPLSILTAFSYEMLLNSETTGKKQSFVLLGAVSVNFTFEIFKSKRRSLIKR